MSKTHEIYNTIMDEFRSELKKGGNPFSVSVQYAYSTKKPYKGFNSFYLAMVSKKKGYTCNQWLTFNQCKALKGTVHKGEKSSPVFFFKPAVVIKFGDEKKWVDPKKADSVIAELKAKGYTVQSEEAFVLKHYLVFNIEQTSLRDRYEYKETKQQISALKQVVFEEITTVEDEERFCKYDKEMDVLTGAHSPYLSYESFFKAITEATSHSKRCNRNIDYEEEEIVKGICASMLGHSTAIEIGMDSSLLDALLERIDKSAYALWKYARLADEAYHWFADRVSAIGKVAA